MNVPLIAYGTWVDDRKDIVLMKDRVKIAIGLGYNHIDTAYNYGTEKSCIQAINELKIPRDKIFFTSKILTLINAKTLRTALGSLQYYDLLLLHYPPLDTGSREKFKSAVLPIWKGMQSYINDGITKAIGVSNFYHNHLELLLEVCDENNLIPPVVNQIEIHPGNLELEYVPYMQKRGIIPFAHTPLGGLGSKYILNNEIFQIIGERIGATPAQVVLSYLLKRNIGVVTSSKNTQHMIESIHAAAFILTPDDMIAIDSTDMGLGPMIEYSNVSWSDNFTLYK